MNKQQYWKELASFGEAEIFITSRTDLLDEEIYNNCIPIGLTNVLSKEITTEEMEVFLQKTKFDRQRQLIKSPVPVDLIYYLWFDEMAGQLRLNFINSNHERLPFGCRLNFVEKESEIINAFLSSPYLEGIPISEFSEVLSDDEPHSDENDYVLNVYSEKITREAMASP